MKEKKVVYEFTFCCEKCCETVITRSDDGDSVKDCPRCHGRMMYSKMREILPDEMAQKILQSSNHVGTTRTVPY